MTRDQIEAFIRNTYAMRLTNDPQALVAAFTGCTRFALSGDPEASRVAGVAEGAEAVAALLTALAETWRWDDCQIESILIDGDHAAVRYHLTVANTATGETVETDVADFIRFRDGRFAEFTQFIDTALAARLSAAATAAAVA